MRTLSLLRRIYRELKRRGYVFLAQEELPLLGDRELLGAVSEGGLLREEALPLVEEAIRKHEAPVRSRREAALGRGDDKAARGPLMRGVLVRPAGEGTIPFGTGQGPYTQGVLALVLSEEAPPPPQAVLVENLEAFYNFDLTRLVLLPPESRQEMPPPGGPLTLIFRGGGGFRPELALALARKAGKVYLAFDLDLAGLALAWHAARELGRGFAGLLYPGREAREALMRRLSASPRLRDRHKTHLQRYRSHRMPEPFAGLWEELLHYGVAVPQEVFFSMPPNLGKA